MITKQSVLVLFLAALCSGCLTTREISREGAIQIAKDAAIANGWKLEEYELESVHETTRKYDGKDFWVVYFEGKVKTVGNHFSVWIEKKTGKRTLFPGA